jgi:hypothetical protein
MTKLRRYLVLAGALLIAAGVGTYALAGGGATRFEAKKLIGYEENPDVSTAASGSLELRINDAANTVRYTLRYSGLEGDVQQAHVHFGKRAINGGILLFLCSNLDNGPAGTPTCPQSGTVTRTVGVADLLAIDGQGIEAANFPEVAAAIRAGRTYGNVHSTKWPGGEIRAQITLRKG